MKRLTSSLAVLIILIGVLSFQEMSGRTVPLIIQAEDVTIATATVRSHGGVIHETFPAIGAVSADVPAGLVASLRADGRIQAVFEDGEVRATGRAPAMDAFKINNRHKFLQLFASHPSLDDRIRALKKLP